jgi:hypothetical protein
VKKVALRHFLCCRGGGLRPGRYIHRHAGGGQTFNSGIADLNYLCAFFLERSRDTPEAVKTLIAENARARGWLIFATHDICKSPSPYGCTPEFFEQVVQWTVESGSRVLPVVQALEVLRASQPGNNSGLRADPRRLAAGVEPTLLSRGSKAHRSRRR